MSLLFGGFGHLIVHFSKFVALDGHLLEGLNEILAMTDGACPVLVGGQARVRLYAAIIASCSCA
jgi:hypothetical protein